MSNLNKKCCEVQLYFLLLKANVKMHLSLEESVIMLVLGCEAVLIYWPNCNTTTSTFITWHTLVQKLVSPYTLKWKTNSYKRVYTHFWAPLFVPFCDLLSSFLLSIHVMNMPTIHQQSQSHRTDISIIMFSFHVVILYKVTMSKGSFEVMNKIKNWYALHQLTKINELLQV